MAPHYSFGSTSGNPEKAPCSTLEKGEIVDCGPTARPTQVPESPGKLRKLGWKLVFEVAMIASSIVVASRFPHLQVVACVLYD